MESIIIQLIVGAVGGNGAAAVLKKYDLGLIGNTVAGLIGGGVGGQLVSTLLGSAAPAGLAGDVAGAGTGGALLIVLVGVVKQFLVKK